MLEVTPTQLPDAVEDLKSCHAALSAIGHATRRINKIAWDLNQVLGQVPAVISLQDQGQELQHNLEIVEQYISNDITRQLHRSQEASGNILKAFLGGRFGDSVEKKDASNV